MTLFFFPPVKPATFGIVHLENLLLKKEAQKGKSSLLESIQDFGKQKHSQKISTTNPGVMSALPPVLRKATLPLGHLWRAKSREQCVSWCSLE